MSWVPFATSPIFWWLEWMEKIHRELVTEKVPHGSIANSNLELAGAFLQKKAAVQCLDIREHTILSKTDNLNGIY